MTTTESTSRDRRQRNSIGFWVALAMVPLLVLGGILVVLETSKGQLVIESEVANVEVKLLKDGKEYDTIQVLPGTHTTRLQAGKYEVLVDASSDRFSIDRDQVVLKRGETVIARISMRDRQPALGTIDPSIAKSTRATASDELLYEGRTLDQWLNVLERDRSVKSINDSLQAVKALVTKRTAESIGDRLLKMMPDLDGHIQLGGDGEASQPLDYKVASVLRQCYRESSVWTKKLCSVMDASDDRFAHRLLSKWHFFRTENDSPLDASLFLTWALEKVFSPRGRTELALPSAEILRAFSINPGYSLTPSEHAAIVETLVQSPVIPRRFFLEALPDSKSDSVWGPVWANAVQRQAIERLMDDASTESEKVMSVTTLRLLRVNATRVKGLEAIPDVPGLVAKVVSELTRLSKESELFQTCVLADSYLMEAAPVMNSETVGSERVQTGLTYAMTIHRGEARGNFALELIRLLKVLPVEKNESLRKALEVVIQKCQPNVVDLLLSSETNPHGLIAGPPRTIAVSWPNLVMQTLNQSSSPNQEHAIQLLSYFLFIEAFDDLVKFDPSRGTILDDLKRQWSVQMVKRFDQDRNGTTSVDEADEGIRSRIWRGFGRTGNQEESTSLFDKNGDGLIEGDELHNCLTKLRKDVSFPNKRKT